MFPRYELEEDPVVVGRWADVPPISPASADRLRAVTRMKLHTVLRVQPSTGVRELVSMQEGLIPSYACDERGAATRTEAHAETMDCNTCFRSAFRRRRCIVPATALHERRQIASHIEQPCSFSLEAGGIFGIAGVWETWTNDENHTVESFAIITVAATSALRSLFKRMPVILTDRGDLERWLHPSRQEEPPYDLLQPLSVSQLRAWRMTPGPVDLHLDEMESVPAQHP